MVVRAVTVKMKSPRFFDLKVKSACWSNEKVVPSRHPERWRQDAAGNVVCKRFANCLDFLCFEYEHITLYSKDKELDIIEMAVYGDVIRPGNLCRCRTIAEMLGEYKSKNKYKARMDPCKLPTSTD